MWKGRQTLRFLEQHVGRRQALRAPVLDEERPVRVEDEVVLLSAERAGRFDDAVLIALDLDEHADRRLVDGDDGVAERVLFAVLLIAEPDREAELLQAAKHG